MLQQLISHNPDIKKLSEEGYDLEINGPFIMARNIPYVNERLEIKYGTLVCALTLVSPSRVGLPQDHTMYFAGDAPCDFQGKVLHSIINNSSNQQLAGNMLVNHYFSSKPVGRINYNDFHEKIMTYARILSSQAQALDKSVSPTPFKLN